MGVLTVRLIKASNLKDADFIGKTDPYVKIELEQDNVVSILNCWLLTSHARTMPFSPFVTCGRFNVHHLLVAIHIQSQKKEVEPKIPISYEKEYPIDKEEALISFCLFMLCFYCYHCFVSIDFTLI